MKDVDTSSPMSPKGMLTSPVVGLPSLGPNHPMIAHLYATRLLSNLNSIRKSAAPTSNNLCDVEIIPGCASKTPYKGCKAKVKSFYAHRIVLAAASPYFNAMFTGGCAEARQSTISLQALSEDTLAAILGFVYSGDVLITRDNVQDLIIAGDMIELPELVELCTAYLVSELDASNVVGIYRFAVDHHCVDLRDATEKFIHENFVEVSKGEEFRDLGRDLLAHFLASEHLRVDSEYQVFSAALDWVESDITGRRRFIFDVLKFIRLPLVPSKLLDSYMSGCHDRSVSLALDSVKKDLVQRKGSLVTLNAQPRLSAKKNIYVIGGSQRELGSAWTRSECTYDTVEVFDTFTGNWRQVEPMRVGRILPGIAVMNGLIFVCGGEVDSQILASGEVYNPNENTWTEMAAMTVPRCEFGMCALGGYIYAFGGWVGEDIGGSIERYDPLTDHWSLITKMAEPRFSMGIVAYQGLIYLVGGCTHSRRHMQELVAYNPATDEWSTMASMLVSRSQMGCVVLEDYLYVLGGTNRHNEVLQSVERYSFAKDAWEFVPAMIEARASPSVAAADGKIFVFGGDKINEVNFYRARTTISGAEVYDPLTNAWSVSAALPESRSEAGAVVI